MKQMKESNHKTTIVLEDNDILEILTLKKNKDKIIVHCINSALHVDEVPMEELEHLKEEKKAIQEMKKYLENHEEDE